MNEIETHLKDLKERLFMHDIDNTMLMDLILER